MTDCPAVINIKGEHFECDWPSDENGKHSGWGHANKKAEAVWTDDKNSLPTKKEQ